MLNIQNIPAYAADYPFLVVIGEVEDLWFYGAYDDLKSAVRVAKTIDGIVVYR